MREMERKKKKEREGKKKKGKEKKKLMKAIFLEREWETVVR